MARMGTQDWRNKTAIIAAAILFVQLILGGFALGTAAAGQPMLDAYGNPLCITSGHASDDGDGMPHSALPDCCTPGCSMFAPATHSDREFVALANPLSASCEAGAAVVFTNEITSTDHDPGNPRAPPLHV